VELAGSAAMMAAFALARRSVKQPKKTWQASIEAATHDR